MNQSKGSNPELEQLENKSHMQQEPHDGKQIDQRQSTAICMEGATFHTVGVDIVVSIEVQHNTYR